MAAQAVGVAAKIGMGLAGRKKKKQALKNAQGAYDMQRQQFENMDTSNLYDNMENVYDNECVNGKWFNLVAHQEVAHDSQVYQEQN